MIELKSVSKKYGKEQALHSVDLTLESGQIIGLFGENGAGKTTLMKCILGFLKYDGVILLDGEKITNKNIARISFATSEHSFFPWINAAAHREFYKEHFEHFRDERFAALMDFFELPFKKEIRTFSNGQKNQFEVVLALSQGADYILMDEPFAGNDLFNREDFYKVLLGILEPEETVLLSTHLIEEVKQFVSRAVLMKRGEIVGDQDMSQLEEEGVDLIDFIKTTYDNEPGRIQTVISALSKEE